MRILVTGSRGFVGRWTIAELTSTGHVVLPDLDDDGTRLDVTDKAAVVRRLGDLRPDAVVHLAAIARPADVAADPTRAFDVNVEGTRNVVAGLIESARPGQAPPVLLVTSSSEVYGVPVAGDLPLREDSPLRPQTPYAASKVAQETVALDAGRQGALRVVVVRAFNHTGPGQRPVYAVPAFASRILAAAATGQATFPVGDLDVRRDLSDVRDVVAAYRRLVEVASDGAGSETDGLVVNVASGRSVTLREVVATLLVLAGATVEPVTDPTLLRPGEAREIRGDPARLRDLTGWQPRIPLEETLRDVLAAAGTPPGGPANQG